jgi:hypothetical protein
MGAAAGSRPSRGIALRAVAPAPLATRPRVPPDWLVVLGFAALLVIAGVARREFLGDGVRHLPVVLSSSIQTGEPRWLLFPALASVWIRLLSAIGLAGGAESALHALVALSVASGIVFLVSLRAWLRVESTDDARGAAALLLAASCGPVLVLFSDVAEPQVGAAIVVTGLAYARTSRDDVRRAPAAVLCAVAAIAIAALIYQGMILALAMLPLVVPPSMSRRRVVMASTVAVVGVITAMIVAQTSTGTPLIDAAATVVRGERNPLARSLMAAPSLGKYVAAVVAGPPQGIVTLNDYRGLRALGASLGSGDRVAVANGVRLLLGLVVTGILLISGIRDRQWRVLAATAILLALPVLRNQQYAYVKFYVLWPIPVALLAIRCRARTTFVVAAIVLAANGWLIAGEIRRGRESDRVVRAAYARATPSTCWLTSGWTPPFAYLWPGHATPMLGTLATGTQPDLQRAALTVALRRCFCDSESVWSDTTSRDAEVVRTIARHFEYTAIDLVAVLIDPKDENPVPGVVVYSDTARQRACSVASR